MGVSKNELFSGVETVVKHVIYMAPPIWLLQTLANKFSQSAEEVYNKCIGSAQKSLQKIIGCAQKCTKLTQKIHKKIDKKTYEGNTKLIIVKKKATKFCFI